MAREEEDAEGEAVDTNDAEEGVDAEQEDHNKKLDPRLLEAGHSSNKMTGDGQCGDLRLTLLTDLCSMRSC